MVVALCRHHLRPGDTETPPLVVADLGCGNRRLERMLEAGFDRPHEYRGYDLCPQSPRTIRIDLERDLPAGTADLAIAVGVLEYLGDVPGFLTRLARFAAVAVVSYVVFDSAEPLSRRQREDRGWRSHYSRAELEALLVTAGYRVVDPEWTNRNRTVVWMARRTAS